MGSADVPYQNDDSMLMARYLRLARSNDVEQRCVVQLIITLQILLRNEITSHDGIAKFVAKRVIVFKSV